MNTELPDARLPDGVLPSGLRPWPRGAAAEAGYYTAPARQLLRELDQEMDRRDVDILRVDPPPLDDSERERWDMLTALAGIGYVSIGQASGRILLGITPAGDRALRLASV